MAKATVNKDLMKCKKCEMYGGKDSFDDAVCKNCRRIDDLEAKLDNVEKLLANCIPGSNIAGDQMPTPIVHTEENDKRTIELIDERLAQLSNSAIESSGADTINGGLVWTSTISNAIETINKKVRKVEEKLQDSVLHDQRRNNVIIHRLEESGATGEDQKRTDDTNAALKLINEVLQVSCGMSNIKRIFRIGKDTGKGRPLLIEFRDGLIKNQVLEALYKLKNAEDRFRKISVTHDMTKEEREQCRKLVAEAKEKQSVSQSGEWLFKVKGAPGAMRIVKLRKQN